LPMEPLAVGRGDQPAVLRLSVALQCHIHIKSIYAVLCQQTLRNSYCCGRCSDILCGAFLFGLTNLISHASRTMAVCCQMHVILGNVPLLCAVSSRGLDYRD
jgi:hypothetical protein